MVISISARLHWFFVSSVSQTDLVKGLSMFVCQFVDQYLQCQSEIID